MPRARNIITGQEQDFGQFNQALADQGWVLIASQSPTPTPTPAPTIGNIYANLLNETPEQRAYREELERQGNYFRDQSNQVVDESTIRRNVTDRFQAEIDALNRVYAEKKKRAMFEGQGRLGSNAAVQARRGLLGSSFGEAQAEGINQFNNEILGDIDAELQASLQNIYSQIKTNVASELSAKQEAKRQGATEYLEFLKGAAERKQQRVSEVVQTILGNNLEPDDATFKSIADQLGISVQMLKAQFNEIKTAQELAEEEALIKRTKQLADIDKVNADVEKIRAEIGLDSKKFTYQQKQDAIKNAIESDRFSWQQKQDLLKSELDNRRLSLDEQKYLLDLQNSLGKREITKINGVDYEFDPETQSYVLPKTPTAPSKDQVQKADDLINLIDKISTNKYLSNAIGPKSALVPQVLRTGRRNEVDALIDNLIAQLTIENLGALKGPMSDKDLQFIMDVSTQGLKKNVSLNSFKQRLQEIRDKFSEIKLRAENPDLTDEDIEQIRGSFNGVGSDTNKATGMRTDRHNNPAAFTTDIAKQAGLVLGKDYEVGDAFPDNLRLRTARLIGDPIATTIKVIDRIGLYTQSGKPRWTYVNSIPGARNWNSLSYNQKANFINKMYQHEGGTALRNVFNPYA